MTTVEVTATRPGGRWWPVAGVVSALLFTVTVALIGDTGETAADTARTLPQHEQALFAAFVTGTLSMIALLVFFAWLNEVIRVAAPQQTVLARLSLAAAIAMAALLPGSLAILEGIAQAGKDTALSPAVASFANNAQFLFLAAGVMFGGVAVFCAMFALKGTQAVPSWLCWSGMVVGVLALGAIFFVPILLFFLWLLIAGIVLLASQSRTIAR